MHINVIRRANPQDVTDREKAHDRIQPSLSSRRKLVVPVVHVVSAALQMDLRASHCGVRCVKSLGESRGHYSRTMDGYHPDTCRLKHSEFQNGLFLKSSSIPHFSCVFLLWLGFLFSSRALLSCLTFMYGIKQTPIATIWVTK